MLRVLEGNPSRRPINDAEPRPGGEAGCPDYLSADAKLKWADVMASVPPGMITPADAPLLEAFCEAWAQFKLATEQLHAAPEPDLFGDGIGRSQRLVRAGIPSPWLKVRADAAKTMATLATRLGLSPADRSGLKLTPQHTKSRWSDLIG